MKHGVIPARGRITALAVCLPALGLCACAADAAEWDLRKVAATARASSCETQHPAEFAFDADPATRWSSDWADHQWLTVDLGQPRRITEITLQWETAHAAEYALDISDDGASWALFRHVTNGNGGVETFPDTGLTARFIRLRAIRRATQWGFSLREFILRGPLPGIEPEFGGLVRPRAIVTLFDHDYERLGRHFAEQCARDPASSSGLSDDEFLDLIERRAFDYFWYEAHPRTLFIVDSTTWKTRTSNAGIGFQLGAYIAGHYRQYRPREEIYARVEQLLDHCWDDPDDPHDLCLEHHDGWTYHWVDIETGKWRGEEHVCTHDSITYLCGVIAAKHYFAGTRAGEIADKILAGVRWDWIIHGGRNDQFVSNCYAPTYNPPCGGDVRFYDGMKFDYLLPIGGLSNAISPVYWHNYALDFPWAAYRGHFWRIERPAPWCHQWDHVWFDFRNMRDDYADYHQNSIEATLANRQWCLDHQMYNADFWGVGPSHGPSPDGVYYGSYGAPPDDLPFQKGLDNDGTISPTATLPSIVFTPREVLRVARFIYDRFKDKVWRRYGFTDALNPRRNWYDREYISIDQGPIVLNIENYRSRLIYKLFEREPIVWNGLRRAGFVGIVDDFDETEHAAPYGQWRVSDTNRSFQIARSTHVVKDGQRALQIRFALPASGRAPFFAVRPDRTDFSPYRFLAAWVCQDPGLQPSLVMDDGRRIPLTETMRHPAEQNWVRRYFELPVATRTGRVSEVRFTVTNAAAGTCWLDGIVLTHAIPSNMAPFVLDDFNVTRAEWIPSTVYRAGLVSGASPAGSNYLRITYTKTGRQDREAALSMRPAIRDWSRCHSLALWVRGRDPLRVRLLDGAGRAFYVGTHVPDAGAGWQRVFFNIQANLNPSNCWEVRYDKRDIREVQLLIAPGRTDFQGEIGLDSITLTE